MKAAVDRSYGPPEVLHLEDVEQPGLREQDTERVLLKVHSAAMNPFDVLYRKGYLPVRLTNGFLRTSHPILGEKTHLTNPSAAGLEILTGLFEQGKLKPVIEKCCPLEQIAAAHRHI